MIELEKSVSEEELKDMAEYNRQTLKEIFIECGYDADYMFDWGMPSFWDDSYWSYPEYAQGLFKFLIKKYSLHIPNITLDTILEE
jgi:hypothetical protein